jgi:hypothetical protein
MSTGIVPREITAVVHRGEPRRGEPPPAHSDGAVERNRAAALAGLRWLSATLEACQAAAAHQPFGVFGTSIAATFLAPRLAEKVSFFVDEDRTRVGHVHLDKPIVAPESIAAGAHLFLALVPWIAEAVGKRLAAADRHLHFPPGWITS